MSSFYLCAGRLVVGLEHLSEGTAEEIFVVGREVLVARGACPQTGAHRGNPVVSFGGLVQQLQEEKEDGEECILIEITNYGK